MNFTLDPAAAEPLHRQVYDGLRAAILSGELGAGERLPATRSLAETLSLSRATISDAYGQLRAEGYIHGRRGSGTFVAVDLPAAPVPNGKSVVAAGTRRAPVRLSDWGRRVASLNVSNLPRNAAEEAYNFDLRPHRLAEDLFPWEGWRAAADRALSRERSSLLMYPPAQGHPDLLEAIASHVSRYRTVQCSADQIVMVNGTQQGLNLLAQLLLEPGDRVAVEDPGYPTARAALEARALEVVRVPVDFGGISVDAMAEGLPFRLIHVTPSHQEPTGATLSLSRRLGLLDLAQHTGCYVLEDDYDSEFRYEGHPVESLQGLDRNGLVLYAGTFSKSVLAGLRLGFLVIPRNLVRQVIEGKRLWDSGSPMLEQAVLAEFIRSGDFERHIRRSRREYRIRRDALIGSLSHHFGERIDVGERHGGLNVLVRMTVGLDEKQIVQRAAREGIGLRSAAAYYSAPPAVPTFLLGFAALSAERITEAVERLSAALD